MRSRGIFEELNQAIQFGSHGIAGHQIFGPRRRQSHRQGSDRSALVVTGFQRGPAIFIQEGTILTLSLEHQSQSTIGFC